MHESGRSKQITLATALVSILRKRGRLQRSTEMPYNQKVGGSILSAPTTSRNRLRNRERWSHHRTP